MPRFRERKMSNDMIVCLCENNKLIKRAKHLFTKKHRCVPLKSQLPMRVLIFNEYVNYYYMSTFSRSLASATAAHHRHHHNQFVNKKTLHIFTASFMIICRCRACIVIFYSQASP